MSELGLERRPHLSHTELTSGHDVTHLLSSINKTHDIKQSKADQILRLLHDQDRLNVDEDEIVDIDIEYNEIPEEHVTRDGDSLTDSSSDNESEVTVAKQEYMKEDDNINISHTNNQRSKEGRSKTSIGFYGFDRNDSGIHLDNETDAMDERGGKVDTRDSTIRPKSSYVRRGQLFRKNTEVDINSASSKDVDLGEEITHRSVSAKARPKSRLGRDSVRRERKIELVEATTVVEPEVAIKDDVVSKPTHTGSLYRRFDTTRRRPSKRTKGFCEDDNNTINNNSTNPNTAGFVNTHHVTPENARAPYHAHPVYSGMDTSVQDMSGVQISANNPTNVTRTPVQGFSNTNVHRNTNTVSYQHRQIPASQSSRADTYVRHNPDVHMAEQQQQHQHQHRQEFQQQQQYQQHAQNYANTQQQQQQQQQQQHRQELQQQQHYQQHAQNYANTQQHQQQQQQHSLRKQQQHQQQIQQQQIQTPSYANIHRSDTVLTVASSGRQDTVIDNNVTPVKRSPSNSNSSYRPKNPEPITARPMGRPEVRPATRQRRLTRRYMQPTQNSMNSVRPTSESVILARQKTEKNLLKKQVDNRPQSEKIPMSNKNILSVSNNPTQGPQTNINMSKEGVTQSSHVGASGFRGYDPGQRLKSSSRSREIPADLTLPRSGMFGARKNLAALMKLPPLEESLAAAKKKERGLTLAQRETCV